MKIKNIILAAAWSVGVLSSSADPLSFASIFSDNAVLQRDMETPIWGVSEPGSDVRMSIRKGDGAVFDAHVKVDANGTWIVKTKPMPAGGPYSITVASAGDASLTITNVLFGDVWICSGQSNMEMNYGWGLTNGKEDIENNTYPDIRLLNVPNRTSIVPKTTFEATWKVCTPEEAKRFSACGYFFGAALKKELADVPIGLVDVTWSGTYIQTWLALESMDGVEGLADAVAARREAIQYWQKGGSAKFEEDLAKWQAQVDPLAGKEVKPCAEDFDDAAWQKALMPATFEKHIETGFDGVVWYRTKVTLSAEQAASPAVLSLGKIDDQDEAYVNGVKVGGLAQYNAARKYNVPGGVLKEGMNVVTVRILDSGLTGGFTGKAEDLLLKVGTNSVSLAGEWAYSANKVIVAAKPENLDQPQANSYSACYNGMFMALFPMAVKGAIWYQGCSNVGGEDLYYKLFEAMVADWRSNLSGGDFPIYIVQLASFLETHAEPVDSSWARMRWVMMQLGEKIKNCGTAVTIDIGDHRDIHPKDKKTVGERLARLALSRTYGRKDIVEAGPIPVGVAKTDAGIVVSFKNAAGLKTADGGEVIGFQVVDAQGKATWAKAAIDGEKVVVTVPEGVEASSVRFAWDDFPACNLVNGDNLPCGPFKMAVE